MHNKFFLIATILMLNQGVVFSANTHNLNSQQDMVDQNNLAEHLSINSKFLENNFSYPNMDLKQIMENTEEFIKNASQNEQLLTLENLYINYFTNPNRTTNLLIVLSRICDLCNKFFKTERTSLVSLNLGATKCNFLFTQYDPKLIRFFCAILAFLQNQKNKTYSLILDDNKTLELERKGSTIMGNYAGTKFSLYNLYIKPINPQDEQNKFNNINKMCTFLQPLFIKINALKGAYASCAQHFDELNKKIKISTPNSQEILVELLYMQKYLLEALYLLKNLSSQINQLQLTKEQINLLHVDTLIFNILKQIILFVNLCDQQDNIILEAKKTRDSLSEELKTLATNNYEQSTKLLENKPFFNIHTTAEDFNKFALIENYRVSDETNNLNSLNDFKKISNLYKQIPEYAKNEALDTKIDELKNLMRQSILRAPPSPMDLLNFILYLDINLLIHNKDGYKEQFNPLIMIQNICNTSSNNSTQNKPVNKKIYSYKKNLPLNAAGNTNLQNTLVSSKNNLKSMDITLEFKDIFKPIASLIPSTYILNLENETKVKLNTINSYINSLIEKIINPNFYVHRHSLKEQLVAAFTALCNLLKLPKQTVDKILETVGEYTDSIPKK